MCARVTTHLLFGSWLDLKLHPGRSSRNSMKVLTARTDVSYLRDYKTGARRGIRGVFVPSGSFCFSWGFGGFFYVKKKTDAGVFYCKLFSSPPTHKNT